MSSPQIERIEEDVEEEDSTEPYQPTTTQESTTHVQQNVENTTDEKPVKNVDAYVGSAQSKPIYACKTVKKLSNDERSMLVNKFEKGVEDPYFKVIRMSNGQIRITKRRNPIVADVKQAQEERSTRIANKVGRLTNEQLLMEHIIDLETRFESMRLKHKKLKKRYNELENSIYEDVDKCVDVGVFETKTTTHVQSQPQNTESEQPIQTQKRRLKRTSWRDAIEYM